jgi:hypothetical protein
VMELATGVMLLGADMAAGLGLNRFVVVIDDAHLDQFTTSCVERAHHRLRAGPDIAATGMVVLTRPPFLPRSQHRYSVGPWVEPFTLAQTAAWLAAAYPDYRWDEQVVGKFQDTCHGVPWLSGQLAQEITRLSSGEPDSAPVSPGQLNEGIAALTARLADTYPELWAGLRPAEKYYLMALAQHADNTGFAADRDLVDDQYEALIDEQKASDEPFEAVRQEDGLNNCVARGLILVDTVVVDARCVLPGLLLFVVGQELPPYPPQARRRTVAQVASPDYYAGNTYP